MRVFDKLKTVTSVAFSPHSWKAALTWRKFSWSSYSLVRRLSAEDKRFRSLVDVGSNVGQFSIAFAERYPNSKIYAFEPLPDCASLLIRNTGDLDIEIQQIAIGGTDDVIDIHVNEHRHSSSLLKLGNRHKAAFPQAREIASIPVAMKRLDSVLRDVDLPEPGLLKIDVQGYEREVLRGATKTLKRIDSILLEVSFTPLYEAEAGFAELSTILNECGFRFVRPVGWLEDPRTGSILQMDALFTRVSDERPFSGSPSH